MDERSADPIDFTWASFDGSTNLPTVYPTNTSIYDLENQVLMSIANTGLQDATVGQNYAVQLFGLGGQAPYTWSLAPSSPGLAYGLTLSPAGLLEGAPSWPGIYDFVVRMTDSGGRFIDRVFTLYIYP
jgi:hypothetical protein